MSLDLTTIPFHELVPVTSSKIAGATVQTVDARQLHAALGVGRDFSTWIKGRIDRFGFVEGQDFVVVAETGGNPAPQNRGATKTSTYEGVNLAIEYVLTLDMAKELAMVENNDQGRAVRRYFLACERMVKEMLGAHGITPQVLGGIVKSVAGKLVEDAIHRKLPELVAAAIATDPRAAACEYRRAIDVVIKLGAEPKGRRALSRRAGNRMDRISKAWSVPVKLSPENQTRMFAAEVVSHWVETEGRALVARHNAAALGQGVLQFPRKSKPAE